VNRVFLIITHKYRFSKGRGRNLLDFDYSWFWKHTTDLLG